MLWTTDAGTEDKLFGNPLVEALKNTREGRYVTAYNGGDDDLLYSIDWGSVLSSRWAIEQALPRILLAADGDPATDANP